MQLVLGSWRVGWMQKIYSGYDLWIWSGSLRPSGSRSLGWKQHLHLLCQELRLWKGMQRKRLQPNGSRDCQLQEDYQVQWGLLQDWPVRSSIGQGSWNLNGRRLYAVCMRNCCFHALGLKKIWRLFFIQSQRFFSSRKILECFFWKRTNKIQSSTRQPLKTLKPFEYTWPLRKDPSNLSLKYLWMLLVRLQKTWEHFVFKNLVNG